MELTANNCNFNVHSNPIADKKENKQTKMFHLYLNINKPFEKKTIKSKIQMNSYLSQEISTKETFLN